MHQPLYEIITTESEKGTLYTTIRNSPDGRRRVVGGRTTQVGFCYEAAWSDFVATHSKTLPNGERKLIAASLRPGFSVDFLPVPSKILGGAA